MICHVTMPVVASPLRDVSAVKADTDIIVYFTSCFGASMLLISCREGNLVSLL